MPQPPQLPVVAPVPPSVVLPLDINLHDVVADLESGWSAHVYPSAEPMPGLRTSTANTPVTASSAP